MWNKECVTCARIKPPDVMALSANFLLCSFLLCPLCQCHRCRQPDHMYGLGLSPSLLPWASGAGNTSDTVFLFFIKHFCISCVLPDPSHDQSPLLGFGELTLVSDSTMGFPNDLKHHSCLMFPQLPGENDSCFFSCLFRGRDCLWLWNQAIGSEWDLFPCLKRCFTHSCEAKLGTVNWTQWRKLHLLTCVGNWHNSFEAHDQGIIALPPDWEASVPCHSCLSFAWELKMAVSPSKYALVTGLITQDLLSTLNTLPWELKKTFFFFFFQRRRTSVLQAGVPAIYEGFGAVVSLCWSVSRPRCTFIQSVFRAEVEKKGELRMAVPVPLQPGFPHTLKPFHTQLARSSSPRLEQDQMEGNLGISFR